MSEPEVRALVQAIVARPNITSYVGYHTFSGVDLRPWSGDPDDDFPTTDLRAFKLMGEEATRLTAQPAISILRTVVERQRARRISRLSGEGGISPPQSLKQFTSAKPASWSIARHSVAV